MIDRTERAGGMCTSELGISHISVTVDENDLQNGAIKILKVIRSTWSEEQIKFKLLTDGITNKLLGCKLDGEEEQETVLIRVYGNKTDLLIDRKAETSNIIFLNKLDLAPELYATFENGLAYKFVPGHTLTVDSVTDSKIYSLVAKRMARLHQAGNVEKSCHKPLIWERIRKFLKTVPESFSDVNKQHRFEEICIPKKRIKQEIEEMKQLLEKTTNPIVFAHNDLLLGNVIYNEETNSVTFIDYEYAGNNYQAYDIGNHFAEFVGLDGCDYLKYYPSKELQVDWINEYLTEFNGTAPSELEVERLYVKVNQFALLSHLFWGTWSLIQTEHSDIDFDYLGYAAIRFNEYLAKKEQFLSLKFPE